MRAGAQSEVRQSTVLVDWAGWRPQVQATLLFVIETARILLIHKKRGLGAGKINGPGGRLEPGESPREGAVREVFEELRIVPHGIAPAGMLRFQFVDGFSIQAHVFKATGFSGTPTETEEAVPLWAAVDKIPYARMWADDQLWMPLMLAAIEFEGWFLFDGDRMLDSTVLATPTCCCLTGAFVDRVRPARLPLPQRGRILQ